MRRLSISLFMTFMSFAGCAADAELSQADLHDDLLAERGDISTENLGIPSTFGKNNTVSDEFFNYEGITGDEVQKFFEQSPYGNRSWLADYRINGKRASDAIVEVSQQNGINPIVMLGRMQTESSLIARTSQPSQSSLDKAMGCGCPDNAPCAPQFKGLVNQINCAADKLRDFYDASATNSGPSFYKRKGQAFTSSDRQTVVPENHATAANYTYTPWVIDPSTGNSGGNKLVWQVTRLYATHFADQGSLEPGEVPSANLGHIEIYWARQADGSYRLHALPGADVQSVKYLVDDIVIGDSNRTLGSNFPDTYQFSQESNGRIFKVEGYDAASKLIAIGLGMIDVTAGHAVFIRQLGLQGYYDIGLDNAPEGVASIKVEIDGFTLTNELTGTTTGLKEGAQHKVRYRMGTVGTRQVKIHTYNADGTQRGTIHREFSFR